MSVVALKKLTKLGTIFLVNVVVLGFLALGFGREYLRNLEIERSIRMLEEQNDDLAHEQLQALAVIESLSSEYYLEGEARKKHGMARTGEELIIVNEAVLQEDRTAAVAAAAEVGNATRWFYYFFDHTRFQELQSL